jgi:GntR family transcriptional regulator
MPLEPAHITINFRLKIPVFEQIAGRIRAEIGAGALRADDQLPTVRQLARQLNINFNTVARAYRQLDLEGLISTQQGRGTYVLGRENPEQPDRSRQVALEALVKQIQLQIERTGFDCSEIAMLLVNQKKSNRPKYSPIKHNHKKMTQQRRSCYMVLTVTLRKKSAVRRYCKHRRRI